MKVIELTHSDAAKHSVSGGKGANLGQLIAAGFDVPPRFVVTAEGYRTFIKELDRMER